MAGLERIPCIVRDMDENQVDEISLIENLQRDDLSVVDEAQAYKRMMEKHGYTQESLARRIGKSRAHIANTVRILGLPEVVLEMVEKKKLTPGHARALLALENQQDQIYAADKINREKLSVRQIEEQIKRKKKVKEAKKQSHPELTDLEERLQKHLGTKAEIIAQKQGGKIEISFYNDEDLERILEIIGI